MMHRATPTQTRNLILAALPDQEMNIFRQEGQRIHLHAGTTLQETGQNSESVFFPTTAVLSLLAVTQDGLSVEAGLIGKEGMVGLPQYFGHRTHPHQCIVQREGEVCQMPASAIRKWHLTSLQMLLLRYSNYRLIELAQTAVCNKFHRVRQRFSRWMLSAQDRFGSSMMNFTQEALASLVGARRPVLTTLMGELQSEGFLEYRRGHLTVLDRAGLERAACECYAIVTEASREFIAGLNVIKRDGS